MIKELAHCTCFQHIILTDDDNDDKKLQNKIRPQRHNNVTDAISYNGLTRWLLNQKYSNINLVQCHTDEQIFYIAFIQLTLSNQKTTIWIAYFNSSGRVHTKKVDSLFLWREGLLYASISTLAVPP